ncbi:MAG: hypothetical protein KC910_26610 [Candidatus Eremiobacteraeota bacterium]|nr:hypothetical protein [Candidatus Eremiobacteraeota bacterium]
MKTLRFGVLLLLCSMLAWAAPDWNGAWSNGSVELMMSEHGGSVQAQLGSAERKFGLHGQMVKPDEVVLHGDDPEREICLYMQADGSLRVVNRMGASSVSYVLQRQD